MPFFEPAYLSSEANFFQLLSGLDQPQRKYCAPRHFRSQQTQQTFTPRFDVCEVDGAYELYGELPGVEQEEILIEFTDAQTLVIKGKTERVPTTTTAPPNIEPESSKDAEISSQTACSPTVEDEYDEADTPLVTLETTATATNHAAPQPQQEQQQDKQEAETPRAKFWITERKVGSFTRSFSFSQRVEQDFVTASLKNGVLHVVVPKSQKRRRVPINVN
jgi:HSP20 family protein